MLDTHSKHDKFYASKCAASPCVSVYTCIAGKPSRRQARVGSWAAPSMRPTMALAAAASSLAASAARAWHTMLPAHALAARSTMVTAHSVTCKLKNSAIWTAGSWTGMIPPRLNWTRQPEPHFSNALIYNGAAHSARAAACHMWNPADHYNMNLSRTLQPEEG